MRFATLILATGLICAAGPAGAVGLFVAPPDRPPPLLDRTAAILLHANGREDLILTATFREVSGDFGWITAFPARPEVSPADQDVFTDVSKLASERRFGHAARFYPTCTGPKSYLALAPGQPVTDIEVVGPGEPDALHEWMNRNGFGLTWDAAKLCSSTWNRGWSLVLVRAVVDMSTLERRGGINGGMLTRLRFRFPAKEPVFPAGFSLPGSRSRIEPFYVIGPEQIVLQGANATQDGFQLFGPVELPPSLAPDGDHRTHAGEPTWLSQVWPGPVTSAESLIRFEAYEPESAFVVSERQEMVQHILRPYAIQRATAATHLGRTRDPRGVPVLVDYLAGADHDNVAVQSALWALGRIGDRSAVPVMLKWADQDDFTARYEALSALAEMRAPEVYPLLLERLTRRKKPKSVTRADGQFVYTLSHGPDPIALERELALRLLVETADSTCLAPLRALAEERCGYERWRRGPCSAEEWMGGEEAVAALAALGDERARETVVAALVEDSDAATPEAMLERAGDDGPRAGFPRAFWMGQVILFGSAVNRWPGLWELNRLFKNLPEVRAGFCREAARDFRVPDAGRIILLSQVTDPTAAERATLHEILRRSSGADALHVRIWAESGEWADWVTYNLNACAVAYAYSNWDAADELLEMWERCPEDDEVLRGEIAFAMALTRSSLVAAPILDYITHEWNRTARTEEFAERIRRSDNERDRQAAARVLRTVDLSYRVREIVAYAVEGGFTSNDLERLMTDPALNPYLRLLWIFARTPDPGGRNLNEVRREAFRRIERQYPYLERLADFRSLLAMHLPER